ncbi:MAG: acyl-CoA thioesterase [Coxiellaceae bacterium]|nr:acyl-CoA thioesterase [Coxiellaceae bacterium]
MDELANKKQPKGELLVRTMAFPKDVNANGDIFGGWVVAQMDIAAASIAYKTAKCRITTVAIDSMSFISPMKVGDFLCCYGELESVGRTSMKIKISTWSLSAKDESRRQITEGIFTFVAINDEGKPIPVKR